MLLRFIILSFSLYFLSSCGALNSDSAKAELSSMNCKKGEYKKYKVTITSNWTKNNFPTKYPSSNAHFSPFVGLVHKTHDLIFSSNSKVSEGFKEVAETGKTAIFAKEIKQHITDKESCGLILAEGISTEDTKGGKSISIIIYVNTEFPYVSLVSMLAPSPDWFIVNTTIMYDKTKAASINYNTAGWLLQASDDLLLYDAGTENGNGFSIHNSSTNPVKFPEKLTEANVGFKDGKGGVNNSKYVASIKFELMN